MTPQELRKQFIDKTALPLLQMYSDAALGVAAFHNTVDEARIECWDIVKSLIVKADDVVNLAWDETDSQEKIEHVLQEVSEGRVTPEKGKDLVALIGMGIESVELVNLAAAVDELNAQMKDE